MYVNTDNNINSYDLNFRDFEVLGHKSNNKSKKKNKKKNKKKSNTYYFYAELGEVINNGIKYFGRHKVSDKYVHTAAFICPVCNELFRADTKKVQNGSIKDCGCTKTRNK